MNADFECPYCKHPIEVCHDDGFGYEEDQKHEMQCPECEKYFVFDTTITISHDAYAAECLNGADHQYSETRAFPKRYRVMRCDICDHEASLPKSRMDEYLAESDPLPTREGVNDGS